MLASRLYEKALAALKAAGIDPDHATGWEYFNNSIDMFLPGVSGSIHVPDARRWFIAIIPGDNEGYYLHVDALTVDYDKLGRQDRQTMTTVFLGKAWSIDDLVPALVVLTKAFDWTHPKTCILEEVE